MHLSDFSENMIKNADGALRSIDPEPQIQDSTITDEDVNKFYNNNDISKKNPMLSDLEDDGSDSGHMDIFINEVNSNIGNFINQLKSKEDINSMDQNLISVAENLRYELSGAVTFQNVIRILQDALINAKMNGSEFANKLLYVVKALISRFRMIFEPNEKTQGPVLVSRLKVAEMVKEAFGEYSQTYPLGGNHTPEAGNNYQSPVHDDRSINKKETAPIMEERSLSMESKNILREHSENLYSALTTAKKSAFELYNEALDYQGDREVKAELIDAASRITRKLEALIDFSESTHYKINRLK